MRFFLVLVQRAKKRKGKTARRKHGGQRKAPPNSR